MASKTYQINGKVYKRAKKQGAPCKPLELCRVYTVSVRMTEQEFDTFCKANRGAMSNSSFANLMIFTGIGQLFESENC